MRAVNTFGVFLSGVCLQKLLLLYEMCSLQFFACRQFLYFKNVQTLILFLQKQFFGWSECGCISSATKYCTICTICRKMLEKVPKMELIQISGDSQKSGGML